MTISRRRFLTTSGGLAGLYLLSPIVARAGRAAGLGADPALSERRRLVVLFQSGGNDGLNTVVPAGDVAGAARASVYRKVRPSIAYSPEQLLGLKRPGDADHQLGLNPALPYLHGLYNEGRVAIVQGVDYPDHNYSHFTSTDIWQSGEPERGPASGWLGRHLDRAGIGEGELRAVGIGYQLPLALRGEDRQGIEIVDVPSTRFADGVDTDPAAKARHDAFAGFGNHPSDEPLRAAVGRAARSTVGLVRDLEATAVPESTGHYFADTMVTARVLLEEDLGVEIVFVEHYGFDTHSGQRVAHEQLMRELDGALRLFWTGAYGDRQVMPPMDAKLADRTLVMTFSEFGRRIGEAGVGESAGTDHGAAAPLFLIGPPASASPLVAGIHGDHPDMGSPTLPSDDLLMTMDLRRVYESVLTSWFANPDPLFRKHPPIGGLFR